MVVGPPAEAIATVKTITDVGLTLATTTDSKNVIYGLGTHYTDAQRDLAIFTGLSWALAPTASVALKSTSSGTTSWYAHELPFATRYGRLTTAMLAMIFAISLSPVRLRC